MTNDQIRIAIAELRGWKYIDNVYGEPSRPDMQYRAGMWHLFENGDIKESGDLPNYPEDLNACREAVMSKPKIFRERFQILLTQRANSKNLLIVELTALDWSEVFLDSERE